MEGQTIDKYHIGIANLIQYISTVFNLKSLALTTLFWGLSITSVLAQSLVIIAPDGEFLGLVGSNGNLCGKYNVDCVWNNNSLYGSDHSVTSIFSNYSLYGSEYGIHSVCNNNISYEQTASLYLVDDRSRTVQFFDVIGADSNTEIGYRLYVLACAR